MLVNNSSKIYVGNTEIEKVYSGQTVVYEKSSPIVYIDYVENNRDAVIETGVVLKKGIPYKIDIQYEATDITKGGECRMVLTAWDSGYNHYIAGKVMSNDPSTWIVSNINNTTTPNQKANGVINTTVGTFTPTRNFVATSPVCLFSQSEQGRHPYPSRHFVGRIYYCKIWENNILIRDLVPVRMNGIDGFLDKVHNEFYTFYDISNAE